MRIRAIAAAVAVPFLTLGAQAEWPVDKKPILDVPGVGAGGVVNFENAAGATRLSNGSLLIADRGPASVRVIDAAGKLVKTVGRTGDGPGEFHVIMSAVGCGPDSLLVWDLNKAEASMVGPTGAVARRFKIPSDSGTRIRRPLVALACGDRGTIAYVSDPTGRLQGATPDLMSMLSSVVTTDRMGKIQAHVDSVPSGEFVAITAPNGGRGGSPRPLGIAASVAVAGDRTIVGISDSVRVMILDAGGKRTIVPVPIQRRPPTRDEFEAAVATVAGMVNPAMRQTLMEQLPKGPMPQFAPAYSGVFSDPSGLMWVAVSPSAGKQMLLGMQLDGRLVARVSLPVPMTVLEVGRDYVLGTYNDANDEPHVAVFKLNRR